MKKPSRSSRWWMAFLFAVAVILVYKAVDNLGSIVAVLSGFLSILSPFIGAFVIAFLLYAPCVRLEGVLTRTKPRLFSRHARGWSVLVVYLAFLAVIALVIWALLPAAIEGITGLIAYFPDYYKTAQEKVAEFARPGGFLENVDVSSHLQKIYDSLMDLLTVENILGYVANTASAITSSLSNVLVAMIVAIYMLLARDSLMRTVRRLAGVVFPEKILAAIGRYLHQSATIFNNYVYSKLLDSVLISLLTLPGLLIVKIPYPAVFLVLIAVCNLIPYFGSIISGVLCVLITLLSGNWGGAIFLAIYILVLEQIDGNLVQPRLFSQSVGIQPFYVLLAITIGGGIGGFIGMLICVPIMAVQMLVKDFIAYREKKQQEKLHETAD